MLVADLDDRRPLPRADGLPDVVRHPLPQSVRLALVRRRLDADRRRLSVVRARRRPAVRRIVDGGTAPECRHRSRVDGGQLRRPRGGAPAGADARAAGCSARCCRTAAIRRQRTGCSTPGRAPCRRRHRKPARAVSSSSWPCRRSSRRSGGASSRISRTPTRCTTSISWSRGSGGRRPTPKSLWRTTLRFPNVWTPAVWTAASTPLARTFLGFARLPAARSFVDQTGTTTVRWTDMRFIDAAPPSPNRGLQRDNLFTTVVRIGPDGQVSRSVWDHEKFKSKFKVKCKVKGKVKFALSTALTFNFELHLNFDL